VACSFASFLATHLSVNPGLFPPWLILALFRSLSRSSSVKPYLETLDQPLRSFVDMANRNECFSDFSRQRTAKERWHSLVSRMGDREEYLETPLPLPPSLYGRSLARSVVRWRHNHDWFPIFLTHGALLARFARWSSAIKLIKRVCIWNYFGEPVVWSKIQMIIKPLQWYWPIYISLQFIRKRFLSYCKSFLHLNKSEKHSALSWSYFTYPKWTCLAHNWRAPEFAWCNYNIQMN